jgi:hypothetical protein
VTLRDVRVISTNDTILAVVYSEFRRKIVWFTLKRKIK